MAVPAPSLATPSLTGTQRLAFKTGSQQLIMGGASNPFAIQKIEGLDKPAVRSGNMNWSMQPGASIGSNQLGTRKITVTFAVRQPFGTYANLPGALAALATAVSTEGTAEYPLWVQLPGFPLVVCQARVIQTAGLNWDVIADSKQILTGCSLQFEATDPYLYSAPTVATSISLPGPAGGFTPPITFPWSFGGAASPNTATITNSGDVTCWPTLVITGPCLNPSVSNTSVPGNPTIGTSIQLNAGDQLWIDCRLGSIMFYPSGSPVGAASQFLLQPGSELFGLPPGASSITFNSADIASVAGALQIQSASAYDGLL